MSAVGQYYHKINGREPRKALVVTNGNLLQQEFRGLRKIYPSTKTPTAPALDDHLMKVRNAMDLSKKQGHDMGTLVIKIAGVMRGRDIMRPSTNRRRPCSPNRDTNLGRFKSEKLRIEEIEGCKWSMRWVLKPSKTDPSGSETRQENCYTRQQPARTVRHKSNTGHAKPERHRAKQRQHKYSGILGSKNPEGIQYRDREKNNHR